VKGDKSTSRRGLRRKEVSVTLKEKPQEAPRQAKRRGKAQNLKRMEDPAAPARKNKKKEETDRKSRRVVLL